MQFSETTNNQGLVQDARWIVGANSASFDIDDVTRSINKYYDKAVTLIFEADGRFQFDDANNAGDAIYTDDLVSGTQSYAIPVTHLRTTRAEIKDTAGNWARLFLIDQNDIQTSLTDFEKTDGTPRFYDLIGNKVYLYPAPNYSQVDSLKLYFQRAGSHFLTTDTTKVPGFASVFHRYLSLGAALDFAMKNNLATYNRIKEELNEMEEDLQMFYSRRAGDENIMLKVPQINYR